MVRTKAFILIMMPVFAWAQHVQLRVADTMVELKATQTQSELRPGWRISDFQLKDKQTRYLMGRHAIQLADDNMPVFDIEPGKDEVLTDYVIIRLEEKRQYRRFRKPNVRENSYVRVEPSAFEIKSDGKEGFVCRPLNALLQGEYVLLNLNQKPVGELKDVVCYPFQVR